jgi:hypothetical protein
MLARYFGASEYWHDRDSGPWEESRRRQYARAEQFYREAVKALTARPLTGNIGVGVVEVGLGRALLRQNHNQEAEKYLTSGYAILITRPARIPTAASGSA